MCKTVKDDFSYYLHDGSHAFRFQLRGRLSLETVRDLEQAWRTASSTIGERNVVFDISGVTTVDASGQDVLSRWRERGALLVASSNDFRTRLQRVTNQPVGLPFGFKGTLTRRRFPRWITSLLLPPYCSREARGALNLEASNIIKGRFSCVHQITRAAREKFASGLLRRRTETS
jgi:anti-anti-sigma regulatory factor